MTTYLHDLQKRYGSGYVKGRLQGGDNIPLGGFEGILYIENFTSPLSSSNFGHVSDPIKYKYYDSHIICMGNYLAQNKADPVWIPFAMPMDKIQIIEDFPHLGMRTLPLGDVGNGAVYLRRLPRRSVIQSFRKSSVEAFIPSFPASMSYFNYYDKYNPWFQTLVENPLEVVFQSSVILSKIWDPEYFSLEMALDLLLDRLNTHFSIAISKHFALAAAPSGDITLNYKQYVCGKITPSPINGSDYIITIPNKLHYLKMYLQKECVIPKRILITIGNITDEAGKV